MKRELWLRIDGTAWITTNSECTCCSGDGESKEKDIIKKVIVWLVMLQLNYM